MAWSSDYSENASSLAHGVLRSTLRKLLESRREPKRFGLHEKLLMTNILQKCRIYVCEVNQDDPDDEEKEDDCEVTDLDEDVPTIVLNNPETAPSPSSMMDESVIADCEAQTVESSQPEVPCPRSPSRKRKSPGNGDYIFDPPLEKISAMDPLFTETDEQQLETLNLPYDDSAASTVLLTDLPLAQSLQKDLEEDFEVNFSSAVPSCDSHSSSEEEDEDLHPTDSTIPQLVNLSSVSNLVNSFSKLSPPSTCGGNQLYLVPYTTNANGDFILQPTSMQVVCLNLNTPTGISGCQPLRLAVPPSA